MTSIHSGVAVEHRERKPCTNARRTVASTTWYISGCSMTLWKDRSTSSSKDASMCGASRKYQLAASRRSFSAADVSRTGRVIPCEKRLSCGPRSRASIDPRVHSVKRREAFLEQFPLPSGNGNIPRSQAVPDLDDEFNPIFRRKAERLTLDLCLVDIVLKIRFSTSESTRYGHFSTAPRVDSILHAAIGRPDRAARHSWPSSGQSSRSA